MEDAGDLVGVGDRCDDAKRATAAATDGYVDGEHPGQELGPADTGFPIWLVTHRELRTARRIRVVFDLLVEHFAQG